MFNNYKTLLNLLKSVIKFTDESGKDKIKDTGIITFYKIILFQSREPLNMNIATRK